MFRKKKKKEEESAGKVLTLIDYRNLIEGLKSIGKNFPYEELKGLARKYGIGLTPRMYISHAVNLNVAMGLGRRGYAVIFCPPSKINGPDTVDERMHEECELLADHPHIGTFVIVSNDSDFRKTEDLLRNHHKKVVRFYLDSQECVLRSTDGEVVGLSEPDKEELFFERNKFVEVVERINKGERSSLDADRIRFLKRVIEACENIHKWGQMSSPNLQSFEPLKVFIWNLIRSKPDVLGKFYQNDCHQAMDALINHSDVILRKEQRFEPRRYYVYNPNHSLQIF